MRRLAVVFLVLLVVGFVAWRQQNHNPSRDKAGLVEAEVESAKKAALAGDGVAATSIALWYGRRGEIKESDKRLAYSIKAKEPKGTGLYAAGLVDGRIPPKEPGKEIPEALELFQWAANRRDPYSIFILGAFTYKGQPPVIQDRERGLEYIRDAASLGDPGAAKWLKDHPQP